MAISAKEIREGVARALIKASIALTEDKVLAYERAISNEKSERAKWVIERILLSSGVSKEKRYPLCNDTGTPHVFMELGDRDLPAYFIKSIEEGIALGLKRLPGRPMAVKGRDWERVEQSRGLYTDPSRMVPPPIIVDYTKGKEIRITVLMLGGGPELRSRTFRVFHLRNSAKFLSSVRDWALEELPKLGCLPGILALGVGRTHYEACVELIKAMAKGDLNQQSPQEKRLTEEINEKGIGPLSLGGETTLLGSFIGVGPLRASGARIVSMRPCCCYEPRRAMVEF